MATGRKECWDEGSDQILQMIRLVVPGRLEFDFLGTEGLENQQVSGRMVLKESLPLGMMNLVFWVFGMMESVEDLILGWLELQSEVVGKMGLMESWNLGMMELMIHQHLVRKFLENFQMLEF